MSLPARSAGRRRRPQWPLAAAWAASVASLIAVALLPRLVSHAHGASLLAVSAGALMVVLAYARLLRRSITLPARTVLLASTRPMPGELLLAGPGTQPCSYRRRADDQGRPQLRTLRYEPSGSERAASLRQSAAP